MERPVSSFQSRKEFVTPSLAKRGLSSGPKPEYFKGGLAYIYIYICFFPRGRKSKWRLSFCLLLCFSLRILPLVEGGGVGIP